MKHGGLKMSDNFFLLMCKSLKILWVKRLLKEEVLLWKIIPEKVGSKLIFLCNYELKKLDLDLPPVYVNNMARSETNVPPNKQRYSWRNIVEQ